MTTNPDRPRVIISADVTVDGRVALARDRPLLTTSDGERWAALFPPGAAELAAQREASLQQHRPTVVLEGSGTFVTGEAPTVPDLPPPDDLDALVTDFLPAEVVDDPTHRSWFAVIDSGGRVAWQTKGGDGVDLLVLVARSTPSAYLGRLRQQRICYLVVGENRVDLDRALARLGELGVGCVVSKAGGGLNGALLRAGLVDELHLLVVPALVGGHGTPTVVDGTPLPLGGLPTPLILRSCRTSDDGAVWLHYEVGPAGTADQPTSPSPALP